jgi:hypothetical protein
MTATYLDVWAGLRDRFRRARPVDLRTGHPVVTDGDLVDLARHWTAALDAHASELAALHGALRTWWRGQIVRMGRAPARDRSVLFWAASRALASTLTDHLRRSPDARRDAAPTAVAGGLVRIEGLRDWLEVWLALKAHFVETRGFELDPDGKRRWPKTTHDDIRQLVALWDRAAAKTRVDVFGVPGAIAAWRAVAEQAKRLGAGADPAALYPENLAFWKVTNRLAIRIQVAAEEPPPLEFWDQLGTNVKAAPGRIADTISTVGGAVGAATKDVAQGAAGVAGDVVAKVGKPFLLGAGVVGAAALGIALLTRGTR